MTIAINTNYGISKLFCNGIPLATLNEEQLDGLRAEIWVALQEMAIKKETLCIGCGQSEYPIEKGICWSCNLVCEQLSEQKNEYETSTP